MGLIPSQHDLLAALMVPAYTTDVDGNITFYNDAAAAFWGVRPELGASRWCGSWRLSLPDGTPLAHRDCPMARTLRHRAPVAGAEAVAERPDGTRIAFMSYPSLVRNADGEVTGAVNLLIDLTERNAGDLQQERLAAIVASSDDIIISKTLDGVITSWNASATRILGFDETEMIGKSILTIIPPELAHEEDVILGKIRRGERIEHFDTERITKDGGRVHLSLTVSPLRDRTGRIVGASKVARDISERKRADDLLHLLFNELNHRVKNTLAIIQSIASQTLKRSPSPAEFVPGFTGRVQALARAHDLLVKGNMKKASIADLINEHVLLGQPDPNITCSGPDVHLDPETAVQMALVLHELATNARKHGALMLPAGSLQIIWRIAPGEPSELILDWQEGGLSGLQASVAVGFGLALIGQAFDAAGGTTKLVFLPGGVWCRITLPLSDVEQKELAGASLTGTSQASPGSVTSKESGLQGRKILVIEDDAVIAMDICGLLEDEGMVVIGPARNLEQVREIAEAGGFEMALVDANLNGKPVHEVVDRLARSEVPFAFCTGYGRAALPPGYDDRPVLAKPFGRNDLVAIVRGLQPDVSIRSY